MTEAIGTAPGIRRRRSTGGLIARWLAAPVTGLIVLFGIWVAGGQVASGDTTGPSDGDTAGDLGYNAANNVNKLVDLDATADANGRAAYADDQPCSGEDDRRYENAQPEPARANHRVPPSTGLAEASGRQSRPRVTTTSPARRADEKVRS